MEVLQKTAWTSTSYVKWSVNSNRIIKLPKGLHKKFTSFQKSEAQKLRILKIIMVKLNYATRYSLIMQDPLMWNSFHIHFQLYKINTFPRSKQISPNHPNLFRRLVKKLGIPSYIWAHLHLPADLAAPNWFQLKCEVLAAPSPAFRDPCCDPETKWQIQKRWRGAFPRKI